MLEDVRRMFTNAVACKRGCGHSRSFSTVWHEILRFLIFCDFCVFSAIDYVCVKTLQLEKTSERFRRQFRLVVFPKIDNKKFEVEKW